jgi:hypothetical protein
MFDNYKLMGFSSGGFAKSIQATLEWLLEPPRLCSVIPLASHSLVYFPGPNTEVLFLG